MRQEMQENQGIFYN